MGVYVSKTITSDGRKYFFKCQYEVCGEDYEGHPAISRKDNKSKICPKCGIGEAFMEFIKHQKKATF